MCHVLMFRPADQVPVPGVHHLRPEELPPLRPELRRRLELREGDGPPAGHGGGDQCFKKFHPKVRNHGEGPYSGLLLVESGYYRFHI